MSSDRIPMSKEGYEKLKAQLDKMKNEDMPRIAEQIAQARGFGDLSENAEFDAAVEAQGMLQARINDLQDKLARGMIVDKSTLPTDRVVFGSQVRVLDLDLNDEEDFILVGPGEEDYDQNKILLTSPIGQGLVGKKVGEVVEVPVPRGHAQAPDRRDQRRLTDRRRRASTRQSGSRGRSIPAAPRPRAAAPSTVSVAVAGPGAGPSARGRAGRSRAGTAATAP